MPFKLNVFTGKPDNVGNFQGILPAAPSYPQVGWTYINSGDNTYNIYYGGTWQVLHTLTPEELSFLLLEDGFILLQENGDKLAVQ